jgi:hypothetical protein
MNLNVSFAMPRGARRGTSLLELIGCLFAVTVGAVAGSWYLGVDLKAYGLSALKSAGVTVAVDETATTAPAANDLPAAPSMFESPETDIPANDATDSAVVPARFAAPLEAPHPAEAFVEDITFQENADLTDDQRQEVTAAYWTALSQLMQDEVDHRTAGVQNSGNLQIDYLTGRSAGHATAAKRIAALNVRGVDPQVTAYAVKARAWHEAGAKLYGRAVDLLTNAPSAQLSGPFAQNWQNAATQHRMEETLLREKHAAVQTSLNHSPRAAAQPND